MYNHDGTIEFCSRRDTQVKIRGLRVELSEVEYRIREELEDVCQVAVDMLATDRGSTLVSYICFSDETRSLPAISDTSIDELFTSPTAEIQALLAAMVGQLKTLLPNYMIPSVFLICKYMPSITSTKLDRKTLRKMTSLLSNDQLSAFSSIDDEKRAPETEVERRFQSIWASILNISAVSIGRDDHFLQIGGDSISAIHLVSKARAEGLEICVKDIFDDSRLLAVASKAILSAGGREMEDAILPFSLLQEAIRDAALKTASELCHVPVSAIEDAFPCTSLQEGLMALSAKQPGSYVAKYVYKLANHVDVPRFKEAWCKTVELCGLLRTRIIPMKDSALQVIVKHLVKWEETTNETLSSLVHSPRALEMTYGAPLCWYALHCEAEANYFVWSAHHAIYDGWTIQVILKALETIYRKVDVPRLRPYNAFIRYNLALDHSAAASFWSTELCGSKRAAFP
ncbi:non-ribosomal peptide synthetase, partial [Trichoderma atroviride IMI 206040]